MKKYWKTLIGTCIYKSTDGIKVYQNSIYRWLTFDNNIIQTLINRHFPANYSLRYIKAITFLHRKLPGPSCLLGLGGGGIAHALGHNTKLTAIEHNSNIVQIARDYFMSDTLKNLEIIKEDANLFLKNCQNKYQHLIIDIYDATSFPSSCVNQEFFYNCKRVLNHDGILAINLASFNDYMSVIKLINTEFGNNQICIPIAKTANMIVYVSKSSSSKYLLNLFEQSYEVKKLIWVDQFGYVAKI